MEDIKFEDVPDVFMCISGEDWYVYADSQGNIYQFIIDMSKHKNRAFEEVKMALVQLKEIIDHKEEVKKVGGTL